MNLVDLIFTWHLNEYIHIDCGHDNSKTRGIHALDQQKTHQGGKQERSFDESSAWVGGENKLVQKLAIA